VVLPLVIFLTELCVVTLSTMRVIFVARGRKALAPLVGFFEITLWLFAIGQIMQHLSDAACYVAFAGGFTLGNLVGLLLENRLALGTLVVRVITGRDAVGLVEQLRAAGFGVTSLEGQGAAGSVTVVLTLVRRKELPAVVGLVRAFDPRAFYSVDEIQAAEAGIFPAERGRGRRLIPFPLPLLPRASGAAAPRLPEALHADEGRGSLASGAGTA
jgi:uncharacterized protein YebE (UPF0316 family)